ncbi:MAG: 3',5'-cyclic-AMP phosphodiesterase [Gammaproteobacteria bacterium]|jgi:Icc protein|nr:3',5'-cyclic-AMP phosphodiesterase [Gammaproteobacteria bacterium]HJP34910.1 3',5'-cyclic-AMP phosphodiesterase [Gammaproteobacteria bacterium]
MQKSALHVLQITDTHIVAAEKGTRSRADTRASFKAVKSAALALRPKYDLILVTGDLAAESEAAAYEWLAEQFEAFAAPVYYLPGNHDAVDTMQPVLGAAGWCCCGSYTVGGWHIVLLDSSVLGEAHGYLGDAELERLDDALSRHPEVPTMVSLHHHPILMESRWMDTMRLLSPERFWGVIDRHAHVRCVLWGHVHQNFDAYRNGVRLLATPSTGVQFAPGSVDFAIDPLPPGFRRLRLSPDGDIETDVIRV